MHLHRVCNELIGEVAMRKLLIFVAIVTAARFAQADNPVSWTINQQINRSDSISIWTSPTAIDLGQMIYQYDFEITNVTATAILTIDITDILEPEFRMGSGFTRVLPTVLIDEAIADSDTGTSANVMVEVDDQGFGQSRITDIQLGSVGFLPISRVNITASVMVTGYGFGDYDLSGEVTAADFDAWSNAFGTSGDLLAVDGNGDGFIDAADYTVWRDHYASPLALVGVGVPEPNAAGLLAIALLAALRKRRGAC